MIGAALSGNFFHAVQLDVEISLCSFMLHICGRKVNHAH